MTPLHVDLLRGAVNGSPVLGRSVAAVRGLLGRPDYVERYARRVDLGYGARSRPRIEVIFNGTAWAIELEDPADVESRLDRPLLLSSQRLQALIARRYAGAFALTRRYHCDAKGCFGIFVSRDGDRRLLFGVSHRHRFLSLQLTQPP